MTFAHTIRSRGTRAAAAALLGCALVGSAIAPLPALAQGVTKTETGSAATTVYLAADASKIIASVPTQVNFLVNGDGTLIAPSDDALAIQNGSVFGIHVAKIRTETTNNFFYCGSAAQTNSENGVELNIAPAGGAAISAADATGGVAPTDAAWNMDRKGSATSSVGVVMSGAVANVTNDLSKNQQFATVNWTFAAGKIS